MELILRKLLPSSTLTLWRCWVDTNKLELQWLFGIYGQEEMTGCGTTRIGRANLWCKSTSIPRLLIMHPGNKYISWRKPPHGSFKCNIAAAFFDELDCTGISMCIRDSLGSFVTAWTQCWCPLLLVMEGEAWALRTALTHVANLGISSTKLTAT